MIKNIDRLLRRYTPDPFLIAIGLTALVFFLALVLTPTTPSEALSHWGNQFWKLLTFTLQMVMILIGGFVVASAPLTQEGLSRLCQIPKSPTQAVILTTLIASLASWLNWGFGLVVGAFLSIEMAKRVKGTSFRVLVASSYSGFLIWHAGLSGSIPLVVNTEGNFSQKWLEQTIPLKETLFSSLNITLLILITLFLIFTNSLIQKRTRKKDNDFSLEKVKPAKENIQPKTPAETWESHWAPNSILFFIGIAFIVIQIINQNFKINLNTINFILFFLGLALHKSPRNFIRAISNGTSKVGPILIQYPLYAGIMGLMTGSGLANLISSIFLDVANVNSFYSLTFLSAGLVNFFVPSGGGQWAVQAPIVITAAQALDASIPKTIMAVAWGDAWTNMLQPFWAIPLLTIAGLHIKDIIGHLLIILLGSGTILTLGFYFL